MTLPRLSAFGVAWNDTPPLHEIVAAFVGYEPKQSEAHDEDYYKNTTRKGRTGRSIDEQMAELAAMFGDGEIRG